jgi:hypothetical protein
MDWSTTAVGPPARWPQCLKTAVSICLGSRHPIVIWRGRSTFIQFYNDAYIPVLGKEKHPAYLGRSGRECWSEIWPTMGPMWDEVFRTEQATWKEDFLYVLNAGRPMARVAGSSLDFAHCCAGTNDGHNRLSHLRL